MDSLVKTFHIDWHLIIAQMVNFAVVVFVLYKFAIKPLSKLMDERKEKISLGLEDAKRHKELLKQTEDEYKKIVNDARKESQEILSSAKKDAENTKRELVEQATEESKNIVEKGKKEILFEKEKMLNELRTELADLVVLSTEKVLKDSLDHDTKEKIIAKISKI